MNKICVLGIINMDMVSRVKKHPKVGETNKSHVKCHKSQVRMKLS